MSGLYPWVPLGLLFLAPFVDPRRPFRLLHLDLVVMLGFSAILLSSVERGFPGPSRDLFAVGTVLVALGLLYLVARMLFEGRRLRDRREPLIPYLPIAWLAVAVALLVCFRIGYTLLDPIGISDVGGAGVIGADEIAEGRGIYGNDKFSDPPVPANFNTEVWHGDTYGPVNYLAYVPFEQALPLGADWHDAAAARVAAIAFDLLMLLGLFALGRRLRPGREGKVLGVTLAYAWVSYPYTLFVISFAFNDTLISLLLVAALLVAASPVRRGAVLALGAAAKLSPAILAPLFAVGVGRPSRRSGVLFGVTFVAVFVVAFLPFVPDGGPSEIYDRTLGYQASRDACCSIWTQSPQLEDVHWLEVPAQVAAVALAVLVAIPSGDRTLRQLAALSAAVLAAVLFATPNFLPSYVVWLAPLVFLALFALDGNESAEPRAARRSSSLSSEASRGLQMRSRG